MGVPQHYERGVHWEPTVWSARMWRTLHREHHTQDFTRSKTECACNKSKCDYSILKHVHRTRYKCTHRVRCSIRRGQAATHVRRDRPACTLAHARSECAGSKQHASLCTITGMYTGGMCPYALMQNALLRASLCSCTKRDAMHAHSRASSGVHRGRTSMLFFQCMHWIHTFEILFRCACLVHASAPSSLH